jgi:hyperosmotically inducible periplasmic protein
MKKKYRETLIMAAVVLLMMTGSLFAQEIDRRIESAFKNSYVFKAYLKGDDIQIHSQNGVVTLTGTVSEETHLSLAADTVADLPGVKSVDNRLEVKGGIPEKNSDAWIHMKVKTVLMLHSNLDGANTEVGVKDGRVTLRGEASSLPAKELTTEYVEDIEGVKGVDNEMTVAKTPHENRRTVGEFIDDASIISQIKLALLFHRGTNAFKTDITVEKGVVTVTGKAKNAAEIKLVTKRIEDIHGVKRIYNRMIIE